MRCWPWTIGLLAGVIVTTVGGCAAWSPVGGHSPVPPKPRYDAQAPSAAATIPTAIPSSSVEPTATTTAPAVHSGGNGAEVYRGQQPGRTPSLPNATPPATTGPNGFNRYPMSASGGNAATGTAGYIPAHAGAAAGYQQPQGAASPYAAVQYGQPVIGQPNYPNTGPTGPEEIAPNGQPFYGEGPYLESLPPPANPLTLPSIGPVPSQIANIDVLTEETQTGRFMFGVGINSDAGVIGNIVIDERNFDMFRFPTSWSDFANGTAFRGGGQGFRLEALPGDRVQRYSVSLTQPYLFGTQVSATTSGFFFDRNFYDWDEQRLGGRLGFGYRLTPDLSANLTVRSEKVKIRNPRVLIPELVTVTGDNELFGGRIGLTHDTRDVAFAPTEGHLFEVTYEQVFGTFDYPRGTVDLRKYFLMRERPDRSGRHTLGYSFRVGVTGSQTPIFENFYAGGYSSLRGFDFRGASPVNMGVIVGGQFQFLGSAEYIFPLTADDMIRGVVFVDYGTVEPEVQIKSDSFRVAPGLGMRLFIPAMGPAPIALDFAFPIAEAATDDKQVFSFFIGFGR